MIFTGTHEKCELEQELFDYPSYWKVEKVGRKNKESKKRIIIALVPSLRLKSY